MELPFPTPLLLRELLGLRVQVIKPDRAGRRHVAEPEHVQALGDVRLVDVVVVPVAGPRSRELAPWRARVGAEGTGAKRDWIGPGHGPRIGRVGEVGRPGPGLVVA